MAEVCLAITFGPHDEGVRTDDVDRVALAERQRAEPATSGEAHRVRLREQVAAAAGIGRVRHLGRAVVVVEEVLVEELAGAVRTGAGDEDRLGRPDPDVLELRGEGGRPGEHVELRGDRGRERVEPRRDGGSPVEHVGSGAGSAATVERAPRKRGLVDADDCERAK